MEHRIITAVGIDVSKYKSMVAVRRPGGEVLPVIEAVLTALRSSKGIKIE